MEEQTDIKYLEKLDKESQWKRIIHFPFFSTDFHLRIHFYLLLTDAEFFYVPGC